MGNWVLAYWHPLKDKFLQSTRGKQVLLILHPKAIARIRDEMGPEKTVSIVWESHIQYRLAAEQITKPLAAW